MNKRSIKKIAAAAMAFAIIGGAITAGNNSVFSSIMTAKAETVEGEDLDHLDNYDPASFSEKTGVLLLNGKVNKQDVRQYCNNEKVKKVSCAKGTVFPVNCGAMFEGFYAKEFDFTNADLSNVDDMSNMFYRLNSGDAKIINLKASNATKMNFMFYNSPTLKSLELSGWDTSNVKSMNGAFMDCTNLETLDLGGLNTSNVEDMGNMFEDCYKLPSIDVSSFDTSKVKYMYNMFIYCQSLKTIDVSNFDTSNVEAMQSMFSHCTSLESIDVSNFDTSNAHDTSCMFLDCIALRPNMVYCSEANMTLNGSLEINFYASQPEYYAKYNNSDIAQNLAKIVMSGPNGDIEITDFEKFDFKYENLIYGKMKLTYPVNAAQANEKITVRAYDKDGNRLIMCNDGAGLCNHSQLECSVQDYIDKLKASLSYQEEHYHNADAKLQILVNAIDNYCKAAENYFKGAENEVKEYKDEYAVTVAPFAPEFGTDVKISLVLDSETAVRIYTNGTGVKIDGNEVSPVTTKYGKCYEIKNIPAHQLMTAHALTVNGKSYKFCPMSYVYRTVNSDSASAELKNAAWAAFLYANAASAYID